jgi:hypothetical protein
MKKLKEWENYNNKKDLWNKFSCVRKRQEKKEERD